MSAGRAEGAMARAAGPVGAPFVAAADVQAAAAQGALTGAQSDALAAARALARAREELAMWQARGRRAWDDAQTAAAQTSGSLGGLTASASSP